MIINYIQWCVVWNVWFLDLVAKIYFFIESFKLLSSLARTQAASAVFWLAGRYCLFTFFGRWMVWNESQIIFRSSYDLIRIELGFF